MSKLKRSGVEISAPARRLSSPRSRPQSSAVSPPFLATRAWASFPTLPPSIPVPWPQVGASGWNGETPFPAPPPGGWLQVSGPHAQGGGGTYNVHDGQHVLFHVSAPVVGHHHLVSHHQGLHVALSADRALQAWLATLCFIPQGPGRWRLQGAQPPWPPLPRFLVWMDNFWSIRCLPLLSSHLSDGSSAQQAARPLILRLQCVCCPDVWFYKEGAAPLPNWLVEQLSHNSQHDRMTS